MNADGYNYNICMAEDSADILNVMNDYNLLGWEAFSVFTNENGILCVALKKPMTERERDLAMLEKHRYEAANKKARR